MKQDAPEKKPAAAEPDKGADDETTRLQRRLQMVEDTGSVTTDNGSHRIHCMTIVGQIEGHYVLPGETKATKYEHMIPQLVAVDESREIEGLLVLLNTVGGDVEAGLALAELIAAGAGRRSFHRCAAGGGGAAVVYCSLCHYDHPSGAHQRAGSGRAPGVYPFSADAGADHRFCVPPFPYDAPAVLPAVYEYRGDGDGCGQCAGWRGSGGGGAH